VLVTHSLQRKSERKEASVIYWTLNEDICLVIKLMCIRKEERNTLISIQFVYCVWHMNIAQIGLVLSQGFSSFPSSLFTFSHPSFKNPFSPFLLIEHAVFQFFVCPIHFSSHCTLQQRETILVRSNNSNKENR
jgi:hypothetical protein